MKTDKQQTLNKIYKLVDLWEAKQIPTMTTQHEVNPGLDPASRENYIYFTLPPSLNFQRSSPAMWQSALKTYQDPTTNYLFFPERVVETPRKKVAQDLTKHKLGLQPNKHTDIWMRLSQTLHDFYNDDPRQILGKGKNDVVKIKRILQETEKKNFPYISGAKMSNYWLYILEHYTDIKLRNRHRISIIPDTHVQQATVVLGMSPERLDPEKTALIWEEVLEGTDLIPVDLHPILWNWSRAGFSPEV